MSNKIFTIGIDVFVAQQEIPKVPETLLGMKLRVISNRGTKIWPGTAPKIQMTDCYCCRYLSDKPIESGTATRALSELEANGFNWVHVEKLLEIDGKQAFSDAQGE